MKKILAIILITLMLCLAFAGCAKKKPEEPKQTSGGGVGLIVDPNAGDYVAPETEKQSGIAIPGWGEITLPPNQTEIVVDFYNPAANEGKYYLVFSAKDYNGEFHLGVAIADKPEGPFIPQEHPIRGAYSIDPCVFKDDDGTIYCYYGGLWGGQLQWHVPLSVNPIMQPDTEPAPIVNCKLSNCKLIDLGHAPDKKTELWAPVGVPALSSYVARMTDDVLQFTEAPRPVVILSPTLGGPLTVEDPHRFFEASWMHKYNGKYYFSYSTGDSHFLCYAIGDNPYGPFTYQGVLLDPVVGWTTHHCIVEFRGQWYLLYHDCVPSGGVTHLRSLKAQRLFYNPDGTIQKVINE